MKSSPVDADDSGTVGGSVAVIGLGYVGACLSSVLTDAGYEVTGIDIDDELVDRINSGECPISEPTVTEQFETAVATGQLSATTDISAVAETDAVMVTVGTPLDDDGKPDVSSVETVADQLGRYVMNNQLIVFRSTVTPGTIADIVRPRLESASGLTAGETFDLAFCPERMAEGTAWKDMTSFPVIVGGVTDESGDRAQAFYEALGLETIRVSDATTAELVKLSENWWIDLNIAAANELGLVSEQLGVDAYEVRAAANSLPIADTTVSFLYPGSGVGGSCLPKDPYFIAETGERNGVEMETPYVSRRVNDRMPGHVVDVTADLLALADDATVAVLGYAFKGGTDDARHTPATAIVEGLADHGFEVRLTDPHVAPATMREETELSPVPLSAALDGADAVVVVTGHDEYAELSADDLIDHVGGTSFAVVDGRRTLDGETLDARGIAYRAIGDGRWFE